MGKFCTKCGRPLQEGEICTCQSTQQESVQAQPIQSQPIQPQPIQEEVPQQVQSNLFTEALENFVGLIKKPFTAGKAIILAADAKIPVILITLQAILSALFGMAVCGKFSTAMKSLFDLIGKDSADFSKGVALTGVLKMPYGRIFILTLLASVALSFALAGMLMAGHKIIKCNVTYNQMLSVVAIRSALLIPSIVVSIALFEIKNSFGIVCFYALGIWGLIAMISVMVSSLEEAKKDEFVHMCSIVIFLFILVAGFVMSQLSTYYLPDVIRTVLNSVNNYISDPSQLLNMMSNM